MLPRAPLPAGSSLALIETPAVRCRLRCASHRPTGQRGSPSRRGGADVAWPASCRA